jgi:hypothetical protein
MASSPSPLWGSAAARCVLAITWWSACLGLPAAWLAVPVTAGLAVAFGARDLAAALRWHSLVPRPLGRCGEPLSGPARRVAVTRLAAASAVGLGALISRTAGWLALIPILYALSNGILREHFPERYGGPTYIWLLFRALVRQAVGDALVHQVVRRLRPRLWLAGAVAVLGAALSGPATHDTRSQFATLAVKWLVEEVRRTPPPGAGQSPGKQSEESSETTMDVPLIPNRPADEKTARLLTDICGSDSLAALPRAAEPLRAHLEARWHELGGVVAGCPTGETVVLPSGVVVAFLQGGESDPAAIVASPDSPRAAFVREDRIEIARLFLKADTLVRVDELAMTPGANYQLFKLTKGCMLSIHSFGVGRIDLTTAQSAAVIQAVATIGGTIESVRKTRDDGTTELTLVVDLDGKSVRVRLVDDGKVSIRSGPDSVIGMTTPPDAACPDRAAADVASRSSS